MEINKLFEKKNIGLEKSYNCMKRVDPQKKILPIVEKTFKKSTSTLFVPVQPSHLNESCKPGWIEILRFGSLGDLEKS
jgi:hypothetical protein